MGNRDESDVVAGGSLAADEAEALITAAGAPQTVETVELVPSAPRNPARELVEAFFRGRNANTMRAYRRDLENFALFLKLPTADAAAQRLLLCAPGDANALVLSYRGAMLEKKLSPATINRRLAAIRALTKLARMLGMISWAVEVESLRSNPYRDTRGPGGAAVSAMLASAITRGDAKGLRDAAIVRLLHDCGLRRGEVVELDRDHYSAARGLSLLGKGRREREWITLPPATRAALEAWLAVRGAAAGPIFMALDENHRGHRLTGGAVHMIVKQLGADVGVKARPHGLRHTAITSVLDKTNGNMRIAQRFSRHRDMQTLMLYDDARRDDAGAAAELIALGDSKLVVACAAGHEYDAVAIGKFCIKNDCGAGSGDRDPARRIEWRQK